MDILIVKLSSLGDIICTLPAVSDACAAHTTIKFDWVVEENFTEIPKLHAGVNQVIPIALRRWRKKLLHGSVAREIHCFIKTLRKRKYDIIIDPQGLLKSAIVTTIARGNSYGFNSKSIREPLAAYFYNRTFSISKTMHTVERMRTLFAKALDYQYHCTLPSYGLESHEIKDVSSFREKYIVFAHGSSRSNKCWPLNKWIELSHLAKTAGFIIMLPWGNEEELSRANTIAKATDNCQILPSLSLRAIASILLQAQGVVAVDTGLGHLAAALTIPAISLYGPTNPKLAGTHGKNQYHLVDMNNLEAKIVWQKLCYAMKSENIS